MDSTRENMMESLLVAIFYSLNTPLFDLSYEWMRYQQ